ncbi:MAG: DUF4430 domain-containing protein, partial [Candidatus Micrarchaeota archaeon]
GPLYCAGVSQNCFVTAVDNVAPSDASDYWRFEVNGVPAAVGVSCYQPASGNSLALRYVGAYSTPTPTPAPTVHASSPTLSPKPSPSPSSSPSLTTPPSRRKPSPSPALPPVGALNARASSPPVMQSATPLAPPAQAPAAQTGFVTAASGLGSATLLVISLALVAAFASLVLHFKRRSRNNEKK